MVHWSRTGSGLGARGSGLGEEIIRVNPRLVEEKSGVNPRLVKDRSARIRGRVHP
jgi:hypothetical protein